jgi:hypothetical protein
MPLKIKIGKPPAPPQATIELQVRKTLSGNLLINDHDKMDIIIVPSENKIVTMPKPYAGDNIYEYQRELMDSLFRGGVIKYDSIQGGINFGMLEGLFGESSEVDPVQVALYEIEKYIMKSTGEDAKAEEYDKNIEDRFTDPSDADSTELGEITPEEDEPYRQSQLDGNYTFTGFGYLY